MELFSERIPPALLAIPNVQRFANILDELCIYKYLNGTAPMDNAFNVLRQSNIQFLQKFMADLGNMPWMSGFPRYLYEQTIINAWDIYKLKGSPKGFKLLISSITDGDCQFDVTGMWSPWALILDDIQCGYLPGGDADLETAYNNPDDYTGWLFDGNSGDNDGFDRYYNTITIAIVSPYVYIPEFRTFLADMIPFFLPMCDPDTCTININFYGHRGVGGETPLTYKLGIGS